MAKREFLCAPLFRRSVSYTHLDVYKRQLKNDAAGDPVVAKEALEYFGVMTEAEYATIAAQTKVICDCLLYTSDVYKRQV